MISKKIDKSNIINFCDTDLTIHKAIETFNEIGLGTILEKVELDEFDKYILEYFYDGITVR